MPTPCPHYSGYGYRNPPAYPQQAGLKPGQMWCHDCGSVVPDPAEVQHRLDAMQPCLRGPTGDCRGEMSARASFAGTGLTIYECAFHRDQSWHRERKRRQDYPEHPPTDFDPADAGESWYGEDDFR
ncbi:hypothetical protein [Nocardia niwae]|uniref:hypothetical protein n=1 Tax=Nocardia niwae TaxID=626084 RepID=UPI003408D5A0